MKFTFFALALALLPFASRAQPPKGKKCSDMAGITDPFCYAITCNYEDGEVVSVSFSKMDGDSCFCKDWGYLGWADDDEAEPSVLVDCCDCVDETGGDDMYMCGAGSGEDSVAVSGGNGPYEVKSATTCFEFNCPESDDDSATQMVANIVEKTTCAYRDDSDSEDEGGPPPGIANAAKGRSRGNQRERKRGLLELNNYEVHKLRGVV